MGLTTLNKAIHLSFHQCITFAGLLLEVLPAKDGHPAAVRSEKFQSFETRQCTGDPWTLGANHVGEVFFREFEIIGLTTVTGGQEPAAQPLSHGMKAITDRRLDDLRDADMGITQEDGGKHTGSAIDRIYRFLREPRASPRAASPLGRAGWRPLTG